MLSYQKELDEPNKFNDICVQQTGKILLKAVNRSKTT